MDRRGLTIDPNAESQSSEKWYKQVGPTRKPAPYATASWAYSQNWVEVLKIQGTNEIVDVLDNGEDFRSWLFPENLFDGGLFSQINFPRDVEDSGLYTSTSSDTLVKQIFASVKVFDTYASSPGKYDEISLEVGELAIDSDGVPVQTDIIVSITDFLQFDNGSNIQNPVPNPNLSYDGGTFAQQGLGIVLDSANYAINNNGEQIYFDNVSVVYIDGSELIADGTPNSGDALAVTRTTIQKDDIPPGKLLGQIDFEVENCAVTITDWSHYNWQDDTPVRKAFKRLVNSLPDDITTVSVKDQPTAFWTSLGFVRGSKDDESLVYSDPLAFKNY